TLADELQLVRAYLAIEQVRFGPRLHLNWDIEPIAASTLQVPTLVLQPLVENTIQHGIAPSAEGGQIWVIGRRKGKEIEIVIGNTMAEHGGGQGTRTAGADVRA
ncbi:hypothetical protein V6O07_18610, partial [Arthrospira platensis SPKY2]